MNVKLREPCPDCRGVMGTAEGSGDLQIVRCTNCSTYRYAASEDEVSAQRTSWLRTLAGRKGHQRMREELAASLDRLVELGIIKAWGNRRDEQAGVDRWYFVPTGDDRVLDYAYVSAWCWVRGAFHALETMAVTV